MSIYKGGNFTFTGTATKTNAIQTSELTLCGFYFPSGWATADVTFETSYDNVTFFPVMRADGTAATLENVAAGTFIAVTPAELAWGQYLKLVSSTNQTNMTVVGAGVRTV